MALRFRRISYIFMYISGAESMIETKVRKVGDSLS